MPAAIGHSFRAIPGISVTTTTTEASIPARSIEPATEQRRLTVGFRVGGDAPVGDGVRCPGALAESRLPRWMVLWSGGGDSRGRPVKTTAGVMTSAAVVMVFVFSVFITLSFDLLKVRRGLGRRRVDRRDDHPDGLAPREHEGARRLERVSRHESVDLCSSDASREAR